MSPTKHPPIWQLWSNVDIISHPGDCWIWCASRFHNGYGRIRMDGHQSRRVHRIVWELRHHQLFPNGCVAMHKCDNPWCVNPDHIEAGTQSQNLKDAYKRGRAKPRSNPWNRGKRSPTCGRGHSREEFGFGKFHCRACDKIRNSTRKRNHENKEPA